MPITAEDWYDADPDVASSYQGDVIDGVPVVFIPPGKVSNWTLLRPNSPVTPQEALAGRTPKVFLPRPEQAVGDAWSYGGAEFVLARASRDRVMIVTQSCDIEHRNFIQVAPVFSAANLQPNRSALLGANEIKYLFFLPSDKRLLAEDSYADLSLITCVHKSYLRTGKLIVRLASPTVTKLQAHLAAFHGRPFGFNTKDISPQDAEYVCSSCFFESATVQRRILTKGTPFPACSECGDKALWVKLGKQIHQP